MPPEFTWEIADRGWTAGIDGFLNYCAEPRTMAVGTAEKLLGGALEEIESRRSAILNAVVVERRDRPHASEQRELDRLDGFEGRLRESLREARLVSAEYRDHPAARALAGALAGREFRGAAWAVAKGELRTEHTYRPDTIAERSFFRDAAQAARGDAEARERLHRADLEAAAFHGLEQRDMSNTATAGGNFVPPLYLADLWVEPNVGRRPFADALPKYPLPPSGTAIEIPQLSSGVTVAARSDAGVVSETDGVTASVTHTVNEISGQVDIGRIAVFRSDPTLDLVLGRTLRRRYDSYLDTQLLSGTGTAPQHLGVRNVSGVNTVTYTDATPTAAELWPKLFQAIQAIASARLEVYADAIVMHPRRAAWVASQLSSTFPLLQQGNLVQAGGTQQGGFVDTFAGLKVIVDPNVGTTYGAGTNEDEIYVVATEDLYLAEDPLMLRVFEDVGSGNGLIRYQVFAFSAFLSKRYPASISVLSGTGLVTPSW